jgi:hypothetical protein
MKLQESATGERCPASRPGPEPAEATTGLHPAVIVVHGPRSGADGHDFDPHPHWRRKQSA